MTTTSSTRTIRTDYLARVEGALAETLAAHGVCSPAVAKEIAQAAALITPEEVYEEERRIQQALGRLSSEHRAVLILKDMEGQKYEAMAEILGVPIGTIRSRLHRARLELREVLEQMEREER